jgi:hypothetical protein
VGSIKHYVFYNPSTPTFKLLSHSYLTLPLSRTVFIAVSHQNIVDGFLTSLTFDCSLFSRVTYSQIIGPPLKMMPGYITLKYGSDAMDFSSNVSLLCRKNRGQTKSLHLI